MERLIKSSGKIWHVFTVIGGTFMMLSVLVIIANIILRRFFNAPIYGSTEIVQYLGLAVASMAIVENEWGDGNILMALIVDKLPEKSHNILNAIEFTIETVIFGIIDWLLVRDVISKFVKGTLTSELKIPRWIPSAVLTIGFIALTLVVATKAILYFWAAKHEKTLNFNEIGRVK